MKLPQPKKSLFVLASIFIAACMSPNIVSSQSSNSNQCDLETMRLLEDFNKNDLEMKSIDIHGLSTEGGIAQIYKGKSGNIAFIQADLFGEVSKVSFSYFFSESELDTYLLKIEEFRYDKPISEIPVKYTSMRIDVFGVCRGEIGNYPEVGAVERIYAHARNVLNHITNVKTRITVMAWTPPPAS